MAHGCQSIDAQFCAVKGHRIKTPGPRKAQKAQNLDAWGCMPNLRKACTDTTLGGKPQWNGKQ